MTQQTPDSPSTSTNPSRREKVGTHSGKIIQISATANSCFALGADGRVYVCVYDAVVDEWLWHETLRTPGAR